MRDLIPVLETERLRLRGHTLADFPHSAAMWADPQVVRFISGTPSSETESWSRFLRYAGHWQMMGFGYWLVEDRQTGAFLGEVGFADYKRDLKPALGALPEIGWVLAPAAWGRGIATEAVTAALHWGDAHLHSPCTVCIFDPLHAASVKVAVKTGYQRRGMAQMGDAPVLVMERSRAAG